jgi:hypothetical protein
MQIYNLPARVQRETDMGLVWEEKITNDQGSLEVVKYSAVRVRAIGATTVTIGGILAATMSDGEIIIFNAGIGVPNDGKKTVTVEIAGANAYVQVAREIERPPGLAGK